MSVVEFWEESLLERTYIMVKPDGVQRRLVGEIIRRFETRGLRLVALKMLSPGRDLAEAHYACIARNPSSANWSILSLRDP